MKCTQHGVSTNYIYDPYSIITYKKNSIVQAIWGYIGEGLINLRKMKVKWLTLMKVKYFLWNLYQDEKMLKTKSQHFFSSWNTADREDFFSHKEARLALTALWGFAM